MQIRRNWDHRLYDENKEETDLMAEDGKSHLYDPKSVSAAKIHKILTMQQKNSKNEKHGQISITILEKELQVVDSEFTDHYKKEFIKSLEARYGVYYGH